MDEKFENVMVHVERSADTQKETVTGISRSSIPVARDEMDDTAFDTMMEHGLSEAKADQSCAASDVFADLRQKMQ